MSPTSEKSRALARVRSQTDNKWAWYELAKAYCCGSLGELIGLVGSMATDDSSSHQGFEEWLLRERVNEIREETNYGQARTDIYLRKGNQELY